MIGRIKELMGKGKVKRGLRKWGTVFQIRNPWLRRDFENLAEEYGVTYESAFDGGNNIMYYVVLDGGATYDKFIINFMHEKNGLFGYFKKDVYGVGVVHIAEK